MQSERPPPSERRFNSSAVEAVIDDFTARMTDPVLARIFANAFPNTLGAFAGQYLAASALGG